MRKHWIVNMKDKTFRETDTETFDGEWKQNYPHTEDADWLDVQAFHIFEPDHIKGIPFVYDLCRDGGMFTLLVDSALHGEGAICTAKAALRARRDVVTLRVLKLTKAQG